MLYAEAFANVGRVVVNCLAIAGGFLLGNLLVLFVCRLIARFFLKERLPVVLERALRVLGGLALAFLVALLVFGDGGWGLGGSGGGTPGGSGGEAKQPPESSKETQPPVPDVKKPVEDVVVDRKVSVTVLRASPNPTSFLFKGDRQAVGIADAKKRLLSLATQTGNQAKIELLIYRDSSGITNADVDEFIRYANELRLHPNVTKLDQSLPE